MIYAGKKYAGKHLNRSKNNLSDKEFIQMCKDVVRRLG